MKTQKKYPWSDLNGSIYLMSPPRGLEQLENAVYTIDKNLMGFYLTKISDNFEFEHKIYGLEDKFIKRVVKTYNSENGNLGVLLNGIKGTGKTVTSKIIANSLNLPIIIVDRQLEDICNFLNDIPQNVVLILDEYEKTFGESTEMLQIMDGALNSKFRRVFILTTNNLYVDSNLLQRPSRIRYLNKFDHLSPSIVEEIVDDCLIHKQFKNQCVKFISNLELITVDIVKAVIKEVNIHEEEPEQFQEIFNVTKLTGSYSIKVSIGGGKYEEVMSSVEICFRPPYNERLIGRYFEADDKMLGEITKILGLNIIEVSPIKNARVEDYKHMVSEPIIIKIEDAYVKHYSYAYAEYESPIDNSLSEINKSSVESFNKAILGRKFESKKTKKQLLIDKKEIF